MHTLASKEKMSLSALKRWATDPRRAPDRTCGACGETFRPANGQAQRSGRGGLFCSRECWKTRVISGPRHPKWSATGRRITQRKNWQPYWAVRVGKSWRLEHTIIAEGVLGRRLKPGEAVHHINGDGLDNRNQNLLICTQSYHALIHQRMAQAWVREHLTGR